MIKTLSPDYPTKVSHKKGKVIAKAGDKVRIISDHMGTMIVEHTKNKERFSVNEKYLK